MRPASDGSPYQEYELTEKGRELVAVLKALEQWGKRWTEVPAEATSAAASKPAEPQSPGGEMP